MKASRRRKSFSDQVHADQGGFILIVTVTLLGFLVLLLVFLSLITRVETAVSANNLKATQARQNALFALRAAIGQLQLEAGPDQRVTATSDLLGLAPDKNTRWTGVWDTTNPGAGPVWLVSQADPDTDPDPDSTLTNSVSLVGNRTAHTAEANQVDVELANIEVHSYPGLEGNQIVGRYAYWVGDEGVKASLAMPDRLNAVDYGPFSVKENRDRLRQQVPYAHQYFRNIRDESDSDYKRSEDPDPDFGFDPAIVSNRDRIPRVISRTQLRVVLPTFKRVNFPRYLNTRFHDFTMASFGVLASTHRDFPGLKQDLSLRPDLLDPGFQSWADYRIESIGDTGYMESPGSLTASTAIPPILNDSDLRRRYFIVAPPPDAVSVGNFVHSVSPIISSFLLQFGIRRDGNSVELASRVFVSIWNPYTSSLVPEDLKLEIAGLPDVEVRVKGGLEAPVVISIQDDTVSPISLLLPFSGTDPEAMSWLPGRTYNWRSSDGSITVLDFNVSELGDVDGSLIPTGLELADSGLLEIKGVGGNVTLTLKQPSVADAILCEIAVPPMSVGEGVVVESLGDSSETWDFGFGFRLLQPSTGDIINCEWLTTDGVDLRAKKPDQALLQPFDPNSDSDTGWDPSTYSGVVDTLYDESPGLLLNRPDSSESATFRKSFFHDTPLFEFPRGPILSLGMLQHMQLEGFRPFSIGNSWSTLELDGLNRTFGSWWDRFFFSGETSDDVRGDSSVIEPLPYYHLRAVDTRATPSGVLDLGDLRSAGGYSSEYLLLQGAFNINSTSEKAWASVLRSIRPSVVFDDSVEPPVLLSWNFVNLTGFEGGQYAGDILAPENFEDENQASNDGFAQTVTRRGSGFFRYSHSAQETFDMDSLTFASESPSGHNRSRFRQGFRGGSLGEDEQEERNLTLIDFDRLSQDIVTLVRTYGPFESMEEFLAPIAGSSPSESVIERAIRIGGINSGGATQSSYMLHQSDVLTAIGPMLSSRSDTFLIRAYGEVTNPIRDRDGDGVGDIEARAWCEAIVQRLPAYVDDFQAPEEAPTGDNAIFGRRFEIVFFRWLSLDDI